MTDIATRVDAKAGYSSWCRRAEHRTCSNVKARCTCTCHGRDGQQPPKKETVMSAPAEVAQLRPPPADGAATKKYPCETCGDSFPTPQARGAHRRYKHGGSVITAAPPVPAKRAATPAQPKRTVKTSRRPKPKPKAETVANVRENVFTPDECRVVADFLDAPLKTVEAVGYMAWLKARA